MQNFFKKLQTRAVCFVTWGTDQYTWHKLGHKTNDIQFCQLYITLKRSQGEKAKYVLWSLNLATTKKKCFEVRITLPHGKAGLIFSFKNYKF